MCAIRVNIIDHGVSPHDQIMFFFLHMNDCYRVDEKHANTCIPKNNTVVNVKMCCCKNKTLMIVYAYKHCMSKPCS